MMTLSGRDMDLLKKISIEIDAYFNATYLNKEVRSTDIYDFIKGRNLLRGVFPTGWYFNRFLRRMHNTGYMKAFISNYYVDTSNTQFYQWYFYRKTKGLSHEVNAESKIIPLGYRKEERNIVTNNGEKVRSKQEAYIYNRLLEETNLDVRYESPIEIGKERRIPDFTVWNKLSTTIYRWEHFGMIEHPSYAHKTAAKLEWYSEKGYQFIQNGGTLIITDHRDGYDHEFHSQVERMIYLINRQS